VESASNDVKTAYADDDVVFDAQGQGGSIIHATGDNAVYNRDQKEVVLTGNVHATTKDPDDEAPTVYQGHQFIYNTLTRSYRLRRDPSKGPQATVVLPPSKTQQRPEVVKPRGSEERETPKKPEEKGGGTGSEEKK